jgi:hypothetical protein
MRSSIAILALLLALGCGTTDGNGPSSEPPPDGEQPELDVKLDASLKPMVEGVTIHAKGRRVCLQGFFDTAAKSKIRMSDYVAPRVRDALQAKGVKQVEREDLDRILDEQEKAGSDLFGPDAQQSIGQLAGAELVLLCPVTRVTKRAYRVLWKLVDVGSGERVASGEITIDRRHLPVKYGGAL